MMSPSRVDRRLKHKRNKSGSLKYDSSSDDRLTPEKLRRRRSPSTPPKYGHREEYRRSSREAERPHASYKVLCVSALHSKASDEFIKDALYGEYKKYGDLSIRVSHDLDERVAYLCFRNSEDAKEARRSKPRVIIYDKVALVEPVYESSRSRGRSRQRSRSYSPIMDRHRGRSRSPGGIPMIPPEMYRPGFYDRLMYPGLPMPPRDFGREMPPMHPDFFPRPPMPMGLPPPHLPIPPHLYGLPGLPPRPAFLPFKPPFPFFDKMTPRMDKFPNYLHHVPPEEDPLATRTLFVGNLELGITDEDLRRVFSQHGVVEDVDVKRPVPGTGNAYAFVRFKNLDMAHKAKVEVSGQHIGKYQCKIGYGKATPTTRIWVGGLGAWTSSTQVETEFERFGTIKKIDYDKADNCAYILYDSVEAAIAAVKEMRGYPLGGPEHKIRVDFAEISSRNFEDKNSSSKSDYFDRKMSSRGGGGGEPFYDPYDPWNGSDYGHGRGGAREESSYDRKYGRNRGGRSPSFDKDWKKDHYSENKRKRSRSRNSDDSDEYRGGGESLSSVRTLNELSRKLNTVWNGGMILKNSLFPAEFYLTDGNRDLVSSLITGGGGGPNILRITQRLRLDQSKLDDVTKRMANSSSHAVFLALQGSPVTSDDSNLQTRPLKNLISYLKQKEAAGVISLHNRGTEVSVLYAFPPSQYAADLLRKTAHSLTDDTLKEDHLTVVIVKGESTGGGNL